jgi:prepilin-type N-terminal cleavage/methylation domain-containing protein
MQSVRRSWIRRAGFTVIELLIVMAIVAILTGLILATSSYVYLKGLRSRTEAEIATMSAALENYRADNGSYPNSGLDPNSINFSDYEVAGKTLFQNLSGDLDGDGQPDSNVPSYMQFKPNQLSPVGGAYFVKDPFGNSYGYSSLGESAGGYNSTFDLWSVADGGPGIDQTKWIKNW